MQTSATQVSSLPGVRCQCVCLRVNTDVVIASYFGHTSSTIECVIICTRLQRASLNKLLTNCWSFSINQDKTGKTLPEKADWIEASACSTFFCLSHTLSVRVQRVRGCATSLCFFILHGFACVVHARASPAWSIVEISVRVRVQVECLGMSGEPQASLVTTMWHVISWNLTRTPQSQTHLTSARKESRRRRSSVSERQREKTRKERKTKSRQSHRADSGHTKSVRSFVFGLLVTQAMTTIETIGPVWCLGGLPCSPSSLLSLAE